MQNTDVAGHRRWRKFARDRMTLIDDLELQRYYPKPPPGLRWNPLHVWLRMIEHQHTIASLMRAAARIIRDYDGDTNIDAPENTNQRSEWINGKVSMGMHVAIAIATVLDCELDDIFPEEAVDTRMRLRRGFATFIVADRLKSRQRQRRSFRLLTMEEVRAIVE